MSKESIELSFESEMFEQFEADNCGALTPKQIQSLHKTIRIGGISLPQVVAGIQYVSENRDFVTKPDFIKCLKELDRRYFLVQDLQWEFAMLDNNHTGKISVQDARFLCKNVHGVMFSENRWNNFLSNRCVPHEHITFAEIEVELCDIPTPQFTRFPSLTPEKKCRPRSAQVTEVKKVSLPVFKDLPTAEKPKPPDVLIEQKQAIEVKEEKKTAPIKPKAFKSATDAKHMKIIKALQDAVVSEDADKITKAVKSFKSAKIKGCDEYLQEAEEMLNQLNCKRTIESGMAEKDVIVIDTGVAKAKKHNLHKTTLKDLVNNAEEMSVRLHRLERLRHEVLELKQSTIAEIRSYSKPPPAVHNVMIATFLLLGTKESATQKWSTVQILLGKTGREGLKRRIMERKITDVQVPMAHRAEKLLSEFDLDLIRDVSAGAATFFVWVEGMIAEVKEGKL